MKIRSVGAELFHADGQRDMTELTVASRNFVKVPWNERGGGANVTSPSKINLFAGNTRRMTAEFLKNVLHYFEENYETTRKSIKLRRK
jgi:hypothetical protein